MSAWMDVCPADDIEPGSWRCIDIDDTAVAVFNVDGAFYAIENVCTHDYGTLTGGATDGAQVMCPRHGARFDIRTGEALTAPAYEPVETFPVRVENGVVQVRDHRDD